MRTSLHTERAAPSARRGRRRSTHTSSASKPRSASLLQERYGIQRRFDLARASDVGQLGFRARQKVLEEEFRNFLLHRVLAQARVQVDEVHAVEILILIEAREDEL